MPAGVGVADVRRWLDELDREMDAVAAPRRYLRDGKMELPDGAVAAARRGDRGSGADDALDDALDAAPDAIVDPDTPSHVGAAEPADSSIARAAEHLAGPVRARVLAAAAREPSLARRVARGEIDSQTELARQRLDSAMEREGVGAPDRRAVLDALSDQRRAHLKERGAADRAAGEKRIAEATGQAGATEAPAGAGALLSGLAEADPDTPVGRAWAALPDDQRRRLIHLADENPGAARRLVDHRASTSDRAAALGDLEETARLGDGHFHAMADRVALAALAEADRVTPRTRAARAESGTDADFAAALGSASAYFADRAAGLPFIRALFDDWAGQRQPTGTGGWSPTFRQYVIGRMRTHVRGAVGEHAAAFGLGDGVIFLKAPKEQVTAGGTDLVAIDLGTGRIMLIDNKALTAAGGARARGDFEGSATVHSVTALTDNLEKNIAADLDEFRAILNQPGTPAHLADRVETAVRGLQAALGRIRDLPPDLKPGAREAEITRILSEHRVERTITTAAGDVDRLSPRLQALGLVLRDLDGEGGGGDGR